MWLSGQKSTGCRSGFCEAGGGGAPCDCVCKCVCVCTSVRVSFVKSSVFPAAVFRQSECCLTPLSRAAVLCWLGGSQVNTDVRPTWQSSSRHTNQVSLSANSGARQLTLKLNCCRCYDFFTKAYIADVLRGFCECLFPLSNSTRPSACASLLSNDVRYFKETFHPKHLYVYKNQPSS